MTLNKMDILRISCTEWRLHKDANQSKAQRVARDLHRVARKMDKVAKKDVALILGRNKCKAGVGVKGVDRDVKNDDSDDDDVFEYIIYK